jgi:glycosyltransferase involved in cell wall biosynthesis
LTKAVRIPIKISVIISTYNRCGLLRRALGSLDGMTVPLDVAWELVVVDNNSTDETKAVCESFQQRSGRQFQYLFEPRQGKSFALNRAVEQSQGEILAFTDDDIWVDPNWLVEILQTFDRFQCAGLGGRVVPVWSSKPPKWYVSEGPYSIGGAIPCYDFGDEFMPVKATPFGANVSVLGSMFRKHGGFRNDLGLFGGIRIGGEDTEFCRRLMNAGELVMYAPTAVVFHPVLEAQTKKSYCQEWHYALGKSIVRREGIPENALRIFGVPGYMIRLFLQNCLTWLLNFRPEKRFYYKLKTCQILGEISESRRPAQ